MKKIRKIALFAAFMAAPCVSVFADVVMFRPQATVGFFSELDPQKNFLLCYNYGGMILFMGDTIRFGMLANHLTLKNADPNNDDDSFLSTGVVLEFVLFKHLILGIGPGYYIGLDNTQKTLGNRFGIYNYAGFEYRVGHFAFLAGFQGDTIFARHLIGACGLLMCVGLSF